MCRVRRAEYSGSPARPRCPWRSCLLTIFLDPAKGKGGITHVVNGTGGSSSIANPSTPVTVVDYPAVP